MLLQCMLGCDGWVKPLETVDENSRVLNPVRRYECLDVCER